MTEEVVLVVRLIHRDIAGKEPIRRRTFVLPETDTVEDVVSVLESDGFDGVLSGEAKIKGENRMHRFEKEEDMRVTVGSFKIQESGDREASYFYGKATGWLPSLWSIIYQKVVEPLNRKSVPARNESSVIRRKGDSRASAIVVEDGAAVAAIVGNFFL
jgi:hypothetical protein